MEDVVSSVYVVTISELPYAVLELHAPPPPRNRNRKTTDRAQRPCSQFYVLFSFIRTPSSVDCGIRGYFPLQIATGRSDRSVFAKLQVLMNRPSIRLISDRKRLYHLGFSELSWITGRPS